MWRVINMNDKSIPSVDDEGVPLPSIDEQIKREQLAKLKAEVRGLTGWSFDTLAKLMIGVLAIAAAAWAFYIGLPKAQIDLYRAMDEVASQQKQIADNSSKLAAQQAEIKQQAEQLVNRNDIVQRTQTALKEATAASGSSAAVLAEARPNVFVQFAGDLTRAQVDALREELEKAGFNAPAAERINRGQENEIRFFTDSADERDRAARVAEVTRGFFQQQRCPLTALERKFVRLPDDKQSPLEVWLIHSCPR
jgi:hypothetical protein